MPYLFVHLANLYVDAEFAMRWLFLFVCFVRLCDPGGTVPREVELSRLFLDPEEETRAASRSTRTRSLNLADLEFEFEILKEKRKYAGNLRAIFFRESGKNKF